MSMRTMWRNTSAQSFSPRAEAKADIIDDASEGTVSCQELDHVKYVLSADYSVRLLSGLNIGRSREKRTR
jgi:hypothetical protein